jgi:pumilio RNA-binding family
MGSSLLGGPYAQGAPALKMLQKRYLGLHQWLGPVCTSKDLKEHIVSAHNISIAYIETLKRGHQFVA